MGEKGLLNWIKRNDIILLLIVYAFGVFIRLVPKLDFDSHLPVFLGDVWYRICMSQYILDFHALPIPDIRYIPYGDVPLWYPPLSMLFYAGVSTVSNLDLPTVMTRVVPFIEGFTPIPLYFLAREWFDRNVARIALVMIAITPSFILYTGIADPQITTLMFMPIVLIYLSRQQYGYSGKAALGIGLLLGFNFLTHLSYFVTIAVMILYIAARKIDGNKVKNELKFFGVALIISLIVSSWWWGPDFLFYWWIFVITTSTLLQSMGSHFTAYGVPFLILGFIGFGYVLVDRLSYLNHFDNNNQRHIAFIAVLFAAIGGVFMGKGVTVPVIAILALVYSFVVIVALKATIRFSTLLSMLLAIIIGGTASTIGHYANNIGNWTRSFTFITASFAYDLEAVGILIAVMFILLMAGVIASRALERKPHITPIISLLSFTFMMLIILVVVGILDPSEIFDTFRQYFNKDTIIAPLSVAMLPTLFVYQFRGNVSKYIMNRKYETFLVLWAIFLLYEVFSENILAVVREYGLMWETTIRPLEGYRFYIFLAQPFSIMAGLMIMEVRKHKTAMFYGFLIFIISLGYIGLEGTEVPDYDMDFKITNSGVFIDDYEAALWFRENSTDDDRIVADYYTAQMFSGVCAGKALIGGLFPLRNIDFNEYIKAPAQVQDDIYDFYKTSDVELTRAIAERYGITHVFISDNMITRGWLGSYKDSRFGVNVNRDKFFRSDLFKIVYEDKSNPYNKVFILTFND